MDSAPGEHKVLEKKKPAMPVIEPNPIEEKKPKEDSAAMKKKKKKRKREPEEGKGNSKSNSQEYLEMEKAGAVNVDEDLEMARRLAKKRKAGKGKFEGDDGFGGDFVSHEETKAHDSNVADGTEFNQEKEKKKKKKAKKDVMGEENDGSVRESEDKTNLDKKRRKKKKDKAEKDSVELDNVDTAEGDDGVVLESEKCSVSLEEGKQLDISKGEHKKREGKKKRKESGNVDQDVGQNTQAAGDVKSGNKEREKSKDKNEGGEKEKEKAAQRKDKGKRVSFIDAVEVFGDGDFVSDEETKVHDLNVADATEFDQKKEKKKKKKAKKDVMGEENGGSFRESEDKTKLDKKRRKKKKRDESDLVHGTRFTPEENAKLMEAMINYAEMKQLGEQGLEMLRTSVKHPELRGCWAEIANALPHRPPVAVYKRARILLNRSADRKWTEEEYETIRRFVATNGPNWTKLAAELGKSDIHVKDTWRRIKPKNLKKGTWTQDEYQNLFDLVNLDLRVKAHQQVDHGHRLIRDNISWEAISDKLTTRSNKDCCLKWYQQLASPLVKEGVWSDTDDYLLVEALQKVDAVCPEDVEWDNLLDHRSGELCRQRWNQMVRLLGGHREKSFIEQVEVLSRRYCPEMLDYRK